MIIRLCLRHDAGRASGNLVECHPRGAVKGSKWQNEKWHCGSEERGREKARPVVNSVVNSVVSGEFG